MRRLLGLVLLVLLSRDVAADDAVRRQRIESNLAHPVAIEGVQGPSLAERMRELGVPAISYAVVEDGRIVSAVAHGVADIESGRPATSKTLFQAASISKPVTAMAVLELVERGQLRLDEPVSSMLRSWRLPENELTAATPVTLRMLLSHTAGTTVHGFPGYPIDAPRPTLAQVLSGEAPANTAPVVVDLAPNTKFRYSGGGTTLAQAVLVDQTGVAFPELMRRTVLGPLGMSSSTYEQPLPRSRRRDAATGYDLAGREIEGKWHVYPEMAAAGLWTTPGDLAKVVIEMQNALAGRDTRLLTIDAARHMLRPRFENAPGEGMGLGFAIQQRGGEAYFTHGGSNRGFRATLIGSMDGGRGAVVMTNSDSGAQVAMQLLRTIAAEYGWPGYAEAPLQRATSDDMSAARVAGRYRLRSGEVVAMRRSGDGLEVLDLTHGWQRLYPVAGGTLARTDRDVQYRLDGENLVVIDDASATKRAEAAATRIAGEEPPSADELLAMGDIEEAKRAYREQFRAKPESLPQATLSRRAYTLFFSGRRPEGLALLEISTELHPDSVDAWDDLGEGRAVAGDIQGAIAAYEEVLRRLDADTSITAERRETLRLNADKQLEKLKRQQ